MFNKAPAPLLPGDNLVTLVVRFIKSVKYEIDVEYFIFTCGWKTHVLRLNYRILPSSHNNHPDMAGTLRLSVFFVFVVLLVDQLL